MATQATYSWIPSTARVVCIDGFGQLPRGTLASIPPLMTWPTKDPNDTLDYVIDISQAIAGNESDSIATLDITITPNDPGDLSIQSATANGDQAILWLTGGVANTTYAVSINISTNGGRRLVRTVSLPVLTMATYPVPGSAITDQSGAPITDQSNNPITTS